MYKVTFAHKEDLSKEYPLYVPGDPNYCLTAGKAALEEGKTGELELSVPYSNTNRTKVICLTDDIILYRSGQSGVFKEIFRGRVITTQQDFYLTGRLSVEGDLAYLYDTLFPPFKFQGAPRDLLNQIVANHNKYVPAYKQFTVGEVRTKDNNNYIARENNAYERTLDLLNSRFIDDEIGGFFRTRYENKTRYLDYLYEYPNRATQNIEFGSNILDLAIEVEYGDLITAVLPLGKMPERQNTSENDPEQTDADRLNVSSVNGGDIYVRDSSLINRYGFIAEQVTWDDVDQPQNLLNKGKAYLKDHGVLVHKFTINVMDLAHVYPDQYEHFNVGDRVPLVSNSHGVNQNVELIKMNLNLLAPEQDTFEFDDENTQNEMGFVANATGSVNKVVQNIISNVDNRVTQVQNNITQTVINNFDTIMDDDMVADAVAGGISAQISQQIIDKLNNYDPLSSGDVERLVDAKLDDYYTKTEVDDIVDGIVDNMESLETELKDYTDQAVGQVRDDISEHVDTKLLEAETAIVGSLDAKYAQIDFANVGVADIGELYAKSGIIQNVVTETGTVTGELVGVTIKGDLIEGGTVKADKLVILGSDGLYYKLNTNGETVEAQQTEYNSLNGSHILAQSITASKISVSDLVAFRADIAGLKMTNGAIHSVGKTNVDSPTPGLYFDSDGQFNTGDEFNYIVSWYDAEADKWKIRISAEDIRIRDGTVSLLDEVTGAVQRVDTAVGQVDDMQDRMDSGEFKGEDAAVLRIDSSRGTVFKNNAVSTVLTVTIYYGSERITDLAGLKSTFGNTAHLTWYWQRLDEDRYGVISASDEMLSNNGFALTLNPSQVDTKVTFRCELEID